MEGKNNSNRSPLISKSDKKAKNRIFEGGEGSGSGSGNDNSFQTVNLNSSSSYPSLEKNTLISRPDY